MEDTSNKQTIVTLLETLRTFIDGPGKGAGAAGQAEEEDEDEEDEEAMAELEQRQNMLDKLGATKMVLLVLSENHKNLDGDLLIAYLLFAIKLLENGNNQVFVFSDMEGGRGDLRGKE